MQQDPVLSRPGLRLSKVLVSAAPAAATIVVLSWQLVSETQKQSR